MADKILQTRIKLKYDTLTNWQTNNPYLLDGEIAVVAIEDKESIEQVTGTKPPQILFKVGAIKNSSTTDPNLRYYHFNDLAWASGLSADVYDWAKASTKPTYAASEITGLKEFVEKHSDFDTNTTYKIITGSKTGMYQLQKKELNGSWVNEGAEFGIDENAIKNLITKAQSKADDAYKLAETKAAKTEAIGTVTQTGVASNQIKVAAVSGTGKNETITINNVAHATNADNATNDSAGNKIDTTYAKLKNNVTFEKINADVIEASRSVISDYFGASGNYSVAEITRPNPETGTVNMVFGSDEGYTSIIGMDDYLKYNNQNLATMTYVDSKVAGAVQYWGIVNKETDLGKDMTISGTPSVEIGKGDFYRVGTAFGGCKIGDLLIAKADQASYTKVSNYDRVIQEDYKGTVTSVTVQGNNGLSGSGTVTSSGTITLSHADTSSQASVNNSGRTVIQDITLDGYGHVTGIGSTTLADADTWRNININGTQLKGNGITTGPVNFKNGSNVTITGSGNDITISTTHQAIKQLDTTSTTSLKTNAVEEIKGSGKIQLHKVSKTGSYNDLVDKLNYWDVKLTPIQWQDFLDKGYLDITSSASAYDQQSRKATFVNIMVSDIKICTLTRVNDVDFTGGNIFTNNQYRFENEEDGTSYLSLNKYVSYWDAVIIDCGSSSTVIH